MSKPDIRLAIYQPDIPQNLGAMIRLCACFGIVIDLIEPCGFPFSIKAIKRTAMDYMDMVKINCHDDFDSFIKEYKYKRRIILLTVKSSKSIWDFKFKSNDILMVGSESSGVSDFVVEKSDAKLIIPMPGGGRSLNVAVSAGIAIGEATRQLNHS